jgi:DNA-binding LytR/AlgR family response regulator
MLALLAWLPGLAILLTLSARSSESGSRWGRFIAVHLAVAVLFSAVHVAGMVALRLGAYAAANAAYQYGPVGERFLYEFRKDLFAYAIFAGAFLMVSLSRQRRRSAERATSFDIRDGARLIRAPVGDILAASSAGNYVEFVLADGRRPLMRTTLTAMENELGSLGFVRVHRSWLINAERVTGLRPHRTGDWTIDLDTCSAPLSRRYRSALTRLKSSGHPAA